MCLYFGVHDFFSVIFIRLKIVDFGDGKVVLQKILLLKSKLQVDTLKMENLRESLNVVKIERDKLDNLETLNYFEVNKSRNLEAKVSKLNMLFILPFTVFVVFVVAIFKC